MGKPRIFRVPTNAILPEFHLEGNAEFQIGECELIAATMAVMLRSGPGGRNIALCTDNQNALSWAEHDRSHSPVASRVLRVLNNFCLEHHIDVMPVYVRSEHNIIADGLTRWTDEQVDQWAVDEGMTPVDGAARLWAVMGLSYRPASSEREPLPNTFAIMGLVLHFLRAYNYRICEWRPSNYAVASFLENWGVSAYSDQVLDASVHELLLGRTTQSISLIGDREVFVLIGMCTSWAEIMDFRRTAGNRSPRYAAMIVPNWLRDGNDSRLWTSQTIIDSAMTGDVWAAPWMVYTSGGIRSHHFDSSATNSEVRTFKASYRLIGQECAPDANGSSRTVAIPGPIGKVVTISANQWQQYREHSHIPAVTEETFQGLSIEWPPCVSTGAQPTLREKLVLLGGHVGILGDALTDSQCLFMVPRLYPVGVVRHILRATQNHFQSNLPSNSTPGRAGGTPGESQVRNFPPQLISRTLGKDRLSAVLSGIAPGTRTKYLTAWHQWESFMKSRCQSPWIWRTAKKGAIT